MNIVIAATIYPPDIGGPATYTKELAQSLVKSGARVNIVAFGDTSRKDSDEGVFIYRIARSHNILVRYLKYLICLMRIAKDSNLVYAQGAVAGGLPALIVKHIIRVPYAVKIVGDYAWEQASVRHRSFRSIELFQKDRKKGINTKIRLLDFIQQLVTRSASLVIVPSNYLKKLVVGWNVQSTRVQVIFNGIKHVPLEQVSAVLQWIPNGPYFLSVARLVPWKGLDQLIGLWPAVTQRYGDINLVIAGSGPEKARLEQLAANSSVSDLIYLIGSQSSAEVNALYSKATGLLINSTYEGFSHVILEAMDARVPVIATDSGGNIELVQHMNNGLLVKTGDKDNIMDAIALLMKDEHLVHSLVEAGVQTAGKYSYDKMLHQTMQALRLVSGMK